VSAGIIRASAIGIFIIGAFCAPLHTTAEQFEVDRNASGSFSLVDHAGRPVTDVDFRGRFLLVFFGYTFCPDICPLDLQIMGEAVDALGESATHVQPIFITVDSERDTVDVLSRYVSHFHPRLIGLTGTPEQIAMAAQNYGVIYVKAMEVSSNADNERAQYLVNHSALIYLLGPDGRFRAAFAHGTDSHEIAAAILRHLNDDSS
jgi:protein SCO1/2